MTTYFVSRHPGAQDWAKKNSLDVDKWVIHLDTSCVKAGDIIIGTLPIHLAETICRLGARYWHLAVYLPEEARGHELQADDLEAYGARLKEYTIYHVPDGA